MKTFLKPQKMVVGTSLVVLLITTGVIVLSDVISTTQNIFSSHAAAILEPYCRDGVYYAKSQIDGTEIACGNAPLCGGVTYAQIEAKNKNNNIWETLGKCWNNKTLGVGKCDTTCKGYVPLCCYDMEITKNPESCYWVERKYCHPSQCAGVPGGNCGDAIVTYCKDIDKCVTDASQIPYIPLDQRVMGGAPTQPTNTPSAPNNPTNTPATPNNTNAFPLKFNNNPARDNTDVLVGVEIADINNKAEIDEIIQYFQGLPLFIKLKRPQNTAIQSIQFDNLIKAGFIFYISQADYGGLNSFAASYHQQYPNAGSSLILELDNAGSLNPGETSKLLSTYPNIRFIAANFGAGDYAGIQKLVDSIPFKTLHAVSYTYPGSSNTDVYGTDFFTANATFFDTADKSFIVKYPTDQFPNENVMNAISQINTPNNSTEQNEARRFGIIAIALFNYAQENGQHGIKYLNMGVFSSFRPHMKSMAQFVAELTKRKMRVFWPNTSTGNGDPWQNNGVLDPSTKPVVGIAADNNTDGVAYFFANGSASNQSLSLAYPPGTTLPSFTRVSNIRGVETNIGIQNDRVDLGPYEVVGLLKGNLTQGGSVTPTSTPAPLPVGTTPITLDFPPIGTPPVVANCPALPETFVDTFRPHNATKSGQQQFSWKPVTGASKYALRINDLENGWKNDCSTSQNPGDVCVENLTTTSHTFTFVEGHTYHIWVHAINGCGTWNKGGHVFVTTPPDVTNNTCRIQGYRTTVGYIDQNKLPFIYGTNINTSQPEISSSLWSVPEIKSRKVSVQNTTPIKDYNVNPYHIIVPGNQTYTVSIEPLTGYTIGSTSCENRTDCHMLGTNATTYQSGNTRTVTCPANGFVDLTWHFAQNSNPQFAPQSCAPLLTNGIKEVKHDIIIIPDGYTDPTAFKKDAESAINDIKQTNLGPLFNKLNFWIATDLSRSYGVTAACAFNSRNCPWDRDKSIETMRWCEADSLLMIGNIPFDQKYTNMGLSILGGKTSLVYRFSIPATAHELAHAIASANDEYDFGKAYDGVYPLEYNCADAPSGKNTSCEKWTTDGLINTQCLPACGYADWHKSSLKSIMSAYEDMIADHTFNSPTLKLWEEALKNFK